MPDDVKGTVFRENLIGDYKQAYDENITNFIFLQFLTLKKKLSAYMENTLTGEKSQKNLPILDQNQFFKISVRYPR
jgi:hypothetical protein